MASSYEDEDEREEACIVCNALYLDSKGGENWTQCSGCKAWAHDTFAKAEEDADTSLCDLAVIGKDEEYVERNGLNVVLFTCRTQHGTVQVYLILSKDWHMINTFSIAHLQMRAKR
ncbi:hypothetical protein J6590_093078 [Homalodisca vitripennis]|nr:hypothetical protein J6590_093078 [Homalodisca vitripennis]